MFKKLDSILTMMKLSSQGECVTYHWETLCLTFGKSNWVGIYLNKSTKKIGFKAIGFNSSTRVKIEKKLGIQQPKVGSICNATYDFKYTTRNCEKIIKLVKLFYSEFEED